MGNVLLQGLNEVFKLSVNVNIVIYLHNSVQLSK